MTGNDGKLLRFDANETGRDYVVGDIHGCFSMLQALLAHIGFERQRDRLFCVGDLIDRGPQSEQVCDWLETPWLHAIRGNHEAMLLDAVVEQDNALIAGPDAPLWRANGGDWFFELPVEQQFAIRQAVQALGLGIEVALTDGRVGALVHADVLEDSWPVTRSYLATADPARLMRDAGFQIVWSRVRAESVVHAISHKTPPGQSVDVAGVDVIYFGHTPMRQPLAVGNTRWLDTGAVFGGTLSIAELAVEGRVWSLQANSDELSIGWYGHL